MHEISHPLRIEIFDRLSRETTSPARLAEALNQDLGKVSYHVNVLLKAGYVRLAKTVPRRGAPEYLYEAAAVEKDVAAEG